MKFNWIVRLVSIAIAIWFVGCSAHPACTWAFTTLEPGTCKSK